MDFSNRSFAFISRTVSREVPRSFCPTVFVEGRHTLPSKDPPCLHNAAHEPRDFSSDGTSYPLVLTLCSRQTLLMTLEIAGPLLTRGPLPHILAPTSGLWSNGTSCPRPPTFPRLRQASCQTSEPEQAATSPPLTVMSSDLLVGRAGPE